MRKSIFHIAAFSLVVMSLLPIAIPGIMLLRKTYVRWEMKEKLEEQQLQTIRVKSSAVHWNLFGDECRIDGKMFDVKNSARDGEFLLLTGLFDDKETEIDEHISRNSEEEDQSAANLIMAFATAIKPRTDNAAITAMMADCTRSWLEKATPALPLSPSFMYTPPPEA